ncbi:MAG: bifunctional UDP-N-acetylglucosamine diphosphorylase/glucosamine-1-phosphate N-acetyltransferase GlmU [Candidatus Lustribacter sp.]
MSRAIVLAAGKGTRMKSAQPKVLHDLCGRPMLWYVLEALRATGVEEIVVVANEELEPQLQPFGVRCVIQTPPRGTGHAVQVALAALEPHEGTVVVAYGDMPLVDATIFEDVQAAVDADAGTALGLVTARMPLPSNFGRVVRHGSTIAKIVEFRDATTAERAIDEMNAGIYAFDERALRSVIGRLSDRNVQGELYLTDTVELLVEDSYRVVGVHAVDYRLVLGVNDRVELSTARATMNERLCHAHMREGVTIVDPATTYLEPGIVIGADSIIAPNTSIGGDSVLGLRTRVGPNCRLYNARLDDDVRVTESVVLDTAIGARGRVGPFAQLRGGNVLGPDVHIGDFVELKNSRLAAGVKANHHSYLGDATIGENTNIGAGTITCNFDGVHKHPTTIGRDAFIGSNSSLVAPVTIGDGAQTGAGTVVIRDVPPGDRVVGNPARSIGAKKAAST